MNCKVGDVLEFCWRVEDGVASLQRRFYLPIVKINKASIKVRTESGNEILVRHTKSGWSSTTLRVIKIMTSDEYKSRCNDPI